MKLWIIRQKWSAEQLPGCCANSLRAIFVQVFNLYSSSNTSIFHTLPCGTKPMLMWEPKGMLIAPNNLEQTAFECCLLVNLKLIYPAWSFKILNNNNALRWVACQKFNVRQRAKRIIFKQNIQYTKSSENTEFHCVMLIIFVPIFPFPKGVCGCDYYTGKCGSATIMCRKWSKELGRRNTESKREPFVVGEVREVGG